MKKLYTVTATFQYVIVADDLTDARNVAIETVDEAFSELSPSRDIDYSIKSYDSGDADYNDACLPFTYYDTPEKTIGEWMNR